MASDLFFKLCLLAVLHRAAIQIAKRISRSRGGKRVWK